MSFLSEYRTEILTDMLRFRSLFAEKPRPDLRVPGAKVCWSDNEKPVFLEVTPISIDQIDQSSGNRVACYTYRDIKCLAPVVGITGGVAIVCGAYKRVHLFRCSDPMALMNAAVQSAIQFVGTSIHSSPTPVTFEWCREARLGTLATPENMISQAEFVVQKVAVYRHGEHGPPVTRTICLTDRLLVERDPLSYRSICAQPLCEVFAILRFRREPQKFSIEYTSGKVHTYHSCDRDSLVCSILDGVRASGNQFVCVRSTNGRRGFRVQPMTVPSSEEVESMHLRFLRQPPDGVSFWETVERFNANVAYSGLVHAVSQDGIFTENKEKLIKDALSVMLVRCPSVRVTSPCGEEQEAAESLDCPMSGLSSREIMLRKQESRFQAIRRLVASKAGFEAFTQLIGIRENLGRAVVVALGEHEDGLTHAVIDAVNTLMQPMHESPDLRQEQLNKASIMSSSIFMGHLVNLFTLHALRGTGSLVISSLLDFFTYALCLPYSETSEGAAFETLLGQVASRGRTLFRLFAHPSLAIVKGAGLVMRALIEEAADDLVANLRQLALSEGALLQHISIACFSSTSDPRNLVLRQLSRQLISLWTENSPQAQDLLRRIFPEGLLSFLESADSPPVSEKDHLYVRDNLQMAQEHVLRVQSKRSEPLVILQDRVDGILQHWRVKIGLQPRRPQPTNIEDKPVSLRLTRQMRIKLGATATEAAPETHEKASAVGVGGGPTKSMRPLNWTLFFYNFALDHAKPDLIWNLRTREELRDAVEKELGEYRRECEYFSYSRLEEPGSNTEGGWEEAFETGSLPGGVGDGDDEDLLSPTASEKVDLNNCVEPSSMDALKARVCTLLKQANLVSWNHVEFRVRYHSLSAEPKVGNYFLRLLLEEDKRVTAACDVAPPSAGGAAGGSGGANPLGLSRIRNSRDFFSELFRRYLQYTASAGGSFGYINTAAILVANNTKKKKNRSGEEEGEGENAIATVSTNPSRQQSRRRRERSHNLLAMRCLCLNAMAVVYGRCHREIGPVSDIPLLVHLLDRTLSATERDCLLILLEKLVLNKYNVDEFLEADGVRVVIDLACLSHLHTNRAPVPTQTNVLKGEEDAESCEGGGATQLEWWYWNHLANPKTSVGPLTFAQMREKLTSGALPPNVYVFAQGLDSQPRCRIDGVYADSDDEAGGTTCDSSFASFGCTTTTGASKMSSGGASYSGGGISPPSASTMGWMPAFRVTQLRWSVPTLLAVDGRDETPSLGDAETAGGQENPLPGLGSSSGALLDHTAVALRCIEILLRLCESSSCRDSSTGGIIRPLPRPRKIITNPCHLPHIVQLLLTFDPPLVERVASLLLHVIEQNPCLPRIYLTGVFFFILMYTGSNVLPIAHFLKATHLLQACLSEEASRHLSDLQARSVLGKILPEAMIAFLENHSPEKFAEIYLGEFDTPEAIWSQEMRRFMIGRLAAHLADFTPRLKSNTRSIYQYIGIPTIVYPQLDGELFCNCYYLRHFCDITRFPDWPVHDAIVLLRDILASWRNEISKKPCKINYEESLRQLELDPSTLKQENEEAIVRRAYYQLSIKYHPDKNPNGQAKFHAINAAYNFLCNRNRISDGPNRRHIQLLIRAQSILYARYRRELAPHKYAGYPMLIKTIQMEVEDSALFMKKKHDYADADEANLSKNAELLSYSTELAYETVATCALNAEEMRREHGLQCLHEAFSRCSEVLSLDSDLNNPLAVNVCCHVVGFLTVSTKFAASCECIHEIPSIVCEVLKLLYYKNLPRLCCQAAACVGAFSSDYWLCHKVHESGGLYMLLNHALSYDFTLDESGVDACSATNSQITLNGLALLCLWAVGRILQGCESSAVGPNQSSSFEVSSLVERALNTLVTPHITRKLATVGALAAPAPVANIDHLLCGEFLSVASESGRTLRHLAKLLTTNSATPCFIWDNQCRAELTTFLEAEVSRIVKTGQPDLEAATAFVHKSFQGELLVGEIFVRIFNKQPTFPLDNPRSFAIDLLRFLGTELDLLPSTSDGLSATTRRVSHIESALEALTNVFSSYTDVSLQCIGHFNILFGVLEKQGYNNLKLRSIEVLQVVSKNAECLNDLYASKLLVLAVILFRALPLAQIPLVDFFNNVIVLNSMLKELVYAGGLIFLLETVVNSEMRDVRLACVHLLSRCLANAQLGRRIQALLGQFLPAIFPETIRDTPEQFLCLFDAEHQNPELIWNQTCREHLSGAIHDMCTKFSKQQDSNRALRWSLPDAYSISYAAAMSECLVSQGLLTETDRSSMETTGGLVVVAGVYLHLYLSQPGWMLRQPDLVLDGLMDKILEAFRKLPQSAQLLRLLSRSIDQLLTDRPGLLDGLPRKGYVHRLIDLFGTVNEPEGARTAVLLLYRMSASKLCVGAMIERETMSGYLHVMRHCIGEELGTLGQTLFTIFNTPGCDPLIAQALKCHLVDHLLQTLHQGLPVAVREPGQCRAYIVKALKVMQKSPLYGSQISAILESDPNWQEFRDQSHALFLTNAPQSTASAYLTAGAGGSSMHSGFLTSSSTAASYPSPINQPPSSQIHTPTNSIDPSMYTMGPGGAPTAPPQPPS